MKLVLQGVTRFGDCLYIENSFLYTDEDVPTLKLSNEQSITLVEKYLSYSIF